MWDKHNRVQHEEPKVRKKECVDPELITDQKLTINTNMEDYVEIIIPLKNNAHGNKKYVNFLDYNNMVQSEGHT